MSVSVFDPNPIDFSGSLSMDIKGFLIMSLMKEDKEKNPDKLAQSSVLPTLCHL